MEYPLDFQIRAQALILSVEPHLFGTDAEREVSALPSVIMLRFSLDKLTSDSKACLGSQGRRAARSDRPRSTGRPPDRQLASYCSCSVFP